jgi:hypothetical protein
LGNEPSKDTATAMSKFFNCHKKYQHKEPLKDLGIPLVIVEEFWEDSDKDYNEFEYGKPLVIMKFGNLAYVCGLQFIEGRIPEAGFKSQSFGINIEMFELHTIYRLRMHDITMMTVMCSLVHVCDEQK